MQSHEHSERNKQPITDVLSKYLDPNGARVLEISSGIHFKRNLTFVGFGQHVAHFAKTFPNVTFQPSEYELKGLHEDSINAYITTYDLKNVLPPVQIDASNVQTPWLQSDEPLQAIVNINMIHISPWACTKGLMYNASKLLPKGGYLFTYGPYNLNGEYTSEGNKNFDVSLKRRNPEWRIRDVSEVEAEANNNGLVLVERVQMPANNFTLIWQKQ